MKRTVAASWLLPGAGKAAASNQIVAIEGGRITAVAAGEAHRAASGTLVIPALGNAHDHARIARLSHGRQL